MEQIRGVVKGLLTQAYGAREVIVRGGKGVKIARLYEQAIRGARETVYDAELTPEQIHAWLTERTPVEIVEIMADAECEFCQHLGETYEPLEQGEAVIIAANLTIPAHTMLWTVIEVLVADEVVDA